MPDFLNVIEVAKSGISKVKNPNSQNSERNVKNLVYKNAIVVAPFLGLT